MLLAASDCAVTGAALAYAAVAARAPVTARSMVREHPNFEVRPSLITGDSADVYLHRTQRILRNEGLNPIVVMEFSSSADAVLCGTMEVRAVLEKVTSVGNREVWSVEEGERVARGGVCFAIRAPYSSFGLYETAICGILGSQTGWATAARQLVDAAGHVPVISVGAHNVHPSVAGIMDYAAAVGGCESGSTILGNRLAHTPAIATVSGALVQILGEPSKAIAAFDRSVAPDVPRVGYLDPRGDLATQAADVARVMKDRLDGIRLARSPGGMPVTALQIQTVREALDGVGAGRVRIILSGPMSPDRIQMLLAERAPVDAFHDSSYIASAAAIPFLPSIRAISDRPVAQETDPPPPNPRLMRLL